MFGLCWVEILPCSIAQSSLVACDINVVFNADPGSVERTRLGRLVVATGWYDDSSVDAGLRSVECD
jgi:hypothetical protein